MTFSSPFLRKYGAIWNANTTFFCTCKFAARRTKYFCFWVNLFFFFFPFPYMCYFMLPACNLADIQMSLAEFRLDKPNICDHPNLTLGSKNTCRSGSRYSTHAPTCGPGWSRSAVTPAVTACFSLSRPSVTTCTHILTSTPPLFSCLSITTITLL